MAGLFSSGEQDMLGNIVQGRQQANQALGSPYGKYGGIVQAGAALADVGADAMFGGKTGAADPRMQQMNEVKNIFSQVAMEVGNTSSADFYQKLSQALSAQYPEQAQKAADKAMEVKKAEFDMKPKATTQSQPQLVQLQIARDTIAAENPNDPRIAEIQKQIDKLGTPTQGTTIVNKQGTQETAEAKAYGESLVESYKAIRDSAKTAANTKVAFETQLNTLNKGFETGFGTEAQAAAANVLGALGVESAKDFATNAQVFKAAASSAILTKQLEQKGPQTEADAKRIEQTSAQLGNTKAANTFLAKVGIALANRDIKQRDFYSKWRTKNKTFEGAEEAWLAGEGGKSLFDSPELKQYKRTDPTEGIPGQGGSSAMPQPTKRFNPATGKLEVIGG